MGGRGGGEERGCWVFKNISLPLLPHSLSLPLSLQMDVDCAKAALRTLVYYDFIVLVDIFKFSNIYVTSTTEAAAFRAFAQSPELLVKCQGFVCNHAAAVAATSAGITAATSVAAGGGVVREEVGKERRPGQGGEAGEASTPRRLLPSGEDLIRLYGACRPDVTLAEVLQTHKEKMSMIDARRFVTFGVVYGFLRRVHRYPVYIRTWNKGGGGLSSSRNSSVGGLIMVPPNRSSSLSQAQDGQRQQQRQQQHHHHHHHQHQHQHQQQHQHQHQQQSSSRSGSYPSSLVEQVQAMLDGTRTMDEVCVAFMRPFEELEEIALSAGVGEVLIVYK